MKPPLVVLPVMMAVLLASPASAQTTTFSEDVLPLLQKHCQSCHRPGQIGPMPLLTYAQARPWARAIRAKVLDRSMPPWFADPAHGRFINDRSMTPDEIDTIRRWVDGGSPEGDPRRAPAPVTWPEHGWLIQPDVVVALPDYPVPARGVLEWQTLAVPGPFKQDTWVTSIEILPGEPSTVHHICFDFLKPPKSLVYNRYQWEDIPRDDSGVEQKPGLIDSLLARVTGKTALTRDVGSSEVVRRPPLPELFTSSKNCYVPGMSTHDYRPLGAGKLVPAGAAIVITLHYDTNGKAAIDRTRIGFTVAQKPPAKQFVHISAQGARAAIGFAIPPHEGNYAVPKPVDIEIRKDAELVWFWPHMHQRGKDVTYTMVRPDGTRQVLLSVPRYDFNWQLGYMTSVKVPKGSRIVATGHYDNSRNNKGNPNPDAWVYPGAQSWEEMFTPAFGLVVDRTVDVKGLTSRYVPERK